MALELKGWTLHTISSSLRLRSCFQHLLKQGNHPVAKCKAPSTVQRQPTSKEVQSTTTQISYDSLHVPGSILLPKTTTNIRHSCKIPFLLTKTSALPTRPRCLHQDLTPGQQSIWGTCSIAVKSSDQLHLVNRLNLAKRLQPHNNKGDSVWGTWEIAVKGPDQLALSQLKDLSKRMYCRSLRIL